MGGDFIEPEEWLETQGYAVCYRNTEIVEVAAGGRTHLMAFWR